MKTFQNVDLDPENVVAWSNETWYQLLGLISIPTCFSLGVIFMIFYYRFHHPDGKMPSLTQQASLF